MAIFVRVVFSGRFDKAAFAVALESAVRRHPLLHARITGDTERNLAWVLSPNLSPWVDYADEGVVMRFPGGFRIDLREENGLRVWVRTGDDRGEIRFQFHHACCDGLATSQFIQDVLCAYDHMVRGSAGSGPAFRPLDPHGLRQRHRLGACWQRRLFHGLVAVVTTIIGPPTFFLVRPTPLHAPEKAKGIDIEINEQVVPEALPWCFAKAQFDALLAGAKRNGVTLNDLMIRDFFLAMQTWNDNHGGERKQVLRLMIPFDLRGPEHDQLSAANIVGMINLDRRFGGAFRWSAPRLLGSIRTETRFLKAFRIPAGYSQAITVIGKLAGGLEKLFQTDRCLTTAVLSNFGRILEDTPLNRRDGKLLAGDLIVEAVEPTSPVRTGSGISCALCTYGDQLSLMMNYDRRSYSPAVAQQLLTHIVARIEQTAAELSGSKS
ncbi:MAG: hypothetical protein ABL994_00840 [Verrucomicrobiales bacterium]